MENWYKLLSTTESYKAEIIRGLLEENQIPVILVNKQDSSYVFLGEIEVHVPVQFKTIALDLINGAITN